MAYSRANTLESIFRASRNFRVGLRHLIRHHIPVKVQHGLDAAASRELLLHSDGGCHSIKPRTDAACRWDSPGLLFTSALCEIHSPLTLRSCDWDALA
jgi:hypothetical protein